MNKKYQDPRTHRNPMPRPTAKDGEVEQVREAKKQLEKTGTRNQFRKTVSEDDRKTRPL